MTDKARELLERAWEELLDAYEGSNGERVAKEIRAYLAELEQDKEPVAYIQRDQLEKAVRSPMLCAVSSEPRQDRVGFFLHPAPQRSFVRLSEETVRWEYEKTKKNLRTVALTEYGWFDAGVRFAEKDYGIGGENE